MPVPVAPLVGFALGALLAIAGGARVEDDRRRALAIVALFAALVFAPACAAPLVVAGDWAFAYLVDAARVPSAVELVLVALDAALVVAGFAWASDPARARSPRAAIALAAVPAALALVLSLVLAPKLALDGTFRQIDGGFGAERVAGGRLGYELAWIGALVVGGAVWTARRLRDPDDHGPRGPRPGSGAGLERARALGLARRER